VSAALVLLVAALIAALSVHGARGRSVAAAAARLRVTSAADAYRWELVVYTNDLPIWAWTISAVVAMAWRSARSRTLSLALPAIFFGALYALFLFVDRPVFIYSAIPLVPFALTAIAFWVTRVSERLGPWSYRAMVALALAWNLYLYPLVSTKAVPLGPYRALLEHSEITLHGAPARPGAPEVRASPGP
jgi:hypothetical protein